MPDRSSKALRVVIIGGGFGGLAAARALRRAPVEITVVDRTNHHLFQPLLYQVAIAGLSPADIASPIRSILARQSNVRVLLGEVVDADLEGKTVKLQAVEEGEAEESIPYDCLVLAAGAKTSYFGHDAWEAHAPGMKTLDDALAIRHRVLLAFERAERETDEAARARYLTFAVIGGGPTGVEVAGAIAELAKKALAKDFRTIDPRAARVILIEAGPRVLSAFVEGLSKEAVVELNELGVDVRTGAKVTDIHARAVELEVDGKAESIPTETVVWAAGVRAVALGEKIGCKTDRSGRIEVGPDLALADHPEVFVIGDLALGKDPNGAPLPGVSQVAIQGGTYVGKIIARRARGEDERRTPFVYWDKGIMATVGRSRAVVQLHRVQFVGFFAWCTWLFIHIWYLIGFRNRLVVMVNWAWSYLTFRRGARLITR